MVEADFPSMRGGGVGRDVPPDAIEVLVGPSDHHHGIPTDDAVKAFFHGQIARVGALVIRVNRVEVRRFHDLNVNASVFGRLNGGLEQTACFTFSPPFGNGLN